jgi:hypothetical protein
LHWFGWAQRFWPSTAVAQKLVQQSLLPVQVCPTRVHADSGTSHLPATQLFEQQSVFWLHG